MLKVVEPLAGTKGWQHKFDAPLAGTKGWQHKFYAKSCRNSS